MCRLLERPSPSRSPPERRGSVPESAGRIGRRVGKWGLAGHHLGEQPSGDGAEGEAVMGVAKGEPQALVTFASPNNRDHVGKAGTPSEPRRRL